MNKIELLGHITDYLHDKGIHHPEKHFHCLNPAHPDKHPSMCLDQKRNHVHCFSCGADYDLIDLISLDKGLSLSEAYREALKRYGKNPSKNDKPAKKTVRHTTIEPYKEKNDSLSTYIETCHKAATQTDYFSIRGIAKNLIEQYKLGFDATLNCVVLPCSSDSFIRRSVHEKKYLNQKGRPSPIFNLQYLDQTDPVFVVEGYFDALAVETLGFRAIALNGAANAGKLGVILQERKTQGQDKLPPLLLMPDRDEAGERWAERLLNECNGFCFSAEPLPACKDINELLLTDRNAAIQVLKKSVEGLDARRVAGQADAEQARLQYLETAAGGCLPALLAHIHDLSHGAALSTGFSTLDERLDGGLYEGLYVIGAVSSLGKTAFVMQLADQVAAGGTDVLVFSLEMSRFELMARSISRESFQNAASGLRGYAKTVRGVLDGRRYVAYSSEERDALTAATLRYTAYADHLFLREGDHETGLEELTQAVEQHLRLTGRRPVVIIDYLQLLAPLDVHYTDKQNVDKVVCGLKKLSRAHSLTILAVSSFNREHYGQAATMAAFKESGGIDYSADVLLGLQVRGAGRSGFDLEAEKRKDPRELELKILKNRSGPLGEPVPLRFYPAYSYFSDER